MAPPPARVHARHGCGEDHAAARLLELGECRLRAEQASLDVDTEQLVACLGELVLGNLGEGNRAVEHSSVADEDIQVAKGVNGFRNGPLVVVEADDVTADRHHRLAELRLEPVDPGADAIHDADACAFLDEARHDRLSDARAAASDQRYLPIEPARGQVLLASSLHALPRAGPLDHVCPLNAGAASRLLPVARPFERGRGPAQPPEDSMWTSASASRSQAGIRLVSCVSTYMVVCCAARPRFRTTLVS